MVVLLAYVRLVSLSIAFDDVGSNDKLIVEALCILRRSGLGVVACSHDDLRILLCTICIFDPHFRNDRDWCQPVLPRIRGIIRRDPSMSLDEITLNFPNSRTIVDHHLHSILFCSRILFLSIYRLSTELTVSGDYVPKYLNWAVEVCCVTNGNSTAMSRHLCL